MNSRILVLGLLLVGSFITVSTVRPGTSAVEVAHAQQASLPTLALSSPITGFVHPVTIANANDQSGRVFVVEQGGRIRIIENGVLLATPFLDLSDRISTGTERGLLGLAFSPDYDANGRFYVNYTNVAGDTVIARYRRSATDADIADKTSEQIVLTVLQPYPTHNGGQLAFGPDDDYLYVALGDGGDAGDPGNRAQNPNELLGKILRINVEAGAPATYTVPTDNPFFNTAGYRKEIWALGLRNPWRFSFDAQTADLYIADVGQGAWEEVNFQSAASAGGENYGWRIMEGLHCYDPASCSMAGLTLPVIEYGHSLGCSVTGGYVYRGNEFASMQGIYFYGDFCTGRIWGLRRGSSGWENNQLLDTSLLISTFGETEAGDILVADYNAGIIYKLIDNPAPPTPTPTPTPSPTPTPTPPAEVTIEFSAAQFQANEGCISSVVLITRAGPSLDARTDTVNLTIADQSANQRTDYTCMSGVVVFEPGETVYPVPIPITEDAFTESDESASMTLSDPSADAVLGSRNEATLVIRANSSSNDTNPIDDAADFVCQHYHDFLSRQGDDEGQNFWTSQIEACIGEPACVDDRRQNVSGSFFLAIEFQETGFLAYRLHKAAFGQMPRYVPFFRDTQQIARGVIVGIGDWRQQLEANKTEFIAAYVNQPAFLVQYPTNMDPATYVGALDANAGGLLSQDERDALIVGLSMGTETRASVLRKIAENEDFKLAESNRAFVLMQYFGYLRRNPDDLPDTDMSGYDYWLKKLNDFNGDFVRAEMVRAFLLSAEYRQRFGSS